ncbi:MAG: preprotein translocase subunit SecA, partial [Chlamydiia bacterium]|nr:preprotein translocase subunit SecA [Chlamydiia bacterium]
MFGILKKIFGTQQSRLLKRYEKLIPKIHAWEEKFQSLSDSELAAKTSEWKKRISEGESLESLLPEAFAAVKNACRRLCGTEVKVSGYTQKWDMVPYDVQLLGGISMFYGSIAEMQTGEGKTLTASLPLYLRALTGKPVHLVTVNDYLAKRDCEWIGAIFRFLGLNVASLT